MVLPKTVYHDWRRFCNRVSKRKHWRVLKELSVRPLKEATSNDLIVRFYGDERRLVVLK